MMKEGINKPKLKKRLTTLDDILDKKYGKKGNPKREVWEQRFETFRLRAKLEEERKKRNDTRKAG